MNHKDSLFRPVLIGILFGLLCALTYVSAVSAEDTPTPVPTLTPVPTYSLIIVLDAPRSACADFVVLGHEPLTLCGGRDSEPLTVPAGDDQNVRQRALSGYVVTSIKCSVPSRDQHPDLAARRIIFDANSAGATVVCTFADSLEPTATPTATQTPVPPTATAQPVATATSVPSVASTAVPPPIVVNVVVPTPTAPVVISPPKTGDAGLAR